MIARQFARALPRRTLDDIAVDVAAQNVLLASYKLRLLLKYDPSEPRVPAGNPDGGEWGEGGGSGVVTRRLNTPLKKGGLSYTQTRKVVAAHNNSGQSNDLVTAIAYKESRFDPKATNPNLHSTAAGMMGLSDKAINDVKARFPGYDAVDKFDPEQNVDTASRYLALRVKWTHGDVRKALTGYGDGTTTYADSILRAEKLLKNARDPLAVLQGCFGK